MPVDLRWELVDGRASCLLRAVHTGSSPAQKMARGNPIATHASIVRARRAVRGVGRKGSTCTQLCPDISPGTRRRPRRRSHRGQEATPSGSAGGELPGPRRGLRGSQRHWGGPPQPAWTAGAHDPGGPTLAASPRRGALQAQQRRHPRRVTPWPCLIYRTPRRTGRATTSGSMGRAAMDAVEQCWARHPGGDVERRSG